MALKCTAIKPLSTFVGYILSVTAFLTSVQSQGQTRDSSNELYSVCTAEVKKYVPAYAMAAEEFMLGNIQTADALFKKAEKEISEIIKDDEELAIVARRTPSSSADIGFSVMNVLNPTEQIVYSGNAYYVSRNVIDLIKDCKPERDFYKIAERLALLDSNSQTQLLQILDAELTKGNEPKLLSGSKCLGPNSKKTLKDYVSMLKLSIPFEASSNIQKGRIPQTEPVEIVLHSLQKKPDELNKYMAQQYDRFKQIYTANKFEWSDKLNIVNVRYYNDERSAMLFNGRLFALYIENGNKVVETWPWSTTGTGGPTKAKLLSLRHDLLTEGGVSDMSNIMHYNESTATLTEQEAVYEVNKYVKMIAKLLQKLAPESVTNTPINQIINNIDAMRQFGEDASSIAENYARNADLCWKRLVRTNKTATWDKVTISTLQDMSAKAANLAKIAAIISNITSKSAKKQINNLSSEKQYYSSYMKKLSQEADAASRILRRSKETNLKAGDSWLLTYYKNLSDTARIACHDIIAGSYLSLAKDDSEVVKLLRDCEKAQRTLVQDPRIVGGDGHMAQKQAIAWLLPQQYQANFHAENYHKTGYPSWTINAIPGRNGIAYVCRDYNINWRIDEGECFDSTPVGTEILLHKGDFATSSIGCQTGQKADFEQFFRLIKKLYGSDWKKAIFNYTLVEVGEQYPEGN